MTPTEAQAKESLRTLLAQYRQLSDDDRKTMSEASVVRQFIDRLLEEVLGWPIKDPERYKYELSTQAGRPDLTLFPERGGTLFIEAKRFGVIKELKQARNTLTGTVTPGQLSLPGMAVDRTSEEQQAINYAFQNNGTWAILTNFEKLRLFNARRDWLVLSFEDPAAYLADFDLLWQLAYPNVINGSLDNLSSQRLRENVDTSYLNFINEWREKLAQDILVRSARNPWVFHADGTIDLGLLRAVVQRFLDRLVVIRFAEDHLVIPPGTLRELYELRRSNPYTFSMDEFLDRFFRQFDENHNSALFAEDLTDSASFSDDALLPLVDKLYEARYRSMPADIIGNTYEQYLGKALALDNGSVTTRDNLETRKKQGSYYTPQVIVRHIVDHSLGRFLYATHNGRPDGDPVQGETRQTSATIHDLRVLDSACGSGSFLIYAYYVLAEFYELEQKRIEAEAEAGRQQLAAQGITSPLDLRIHLTPFLTELERIRDYPRLILEHHLYGVDLDPQAAEIAVVNLMMRAMERRGHEKRLPLILNQNVKVGNSLIGLRPDDPALDEYRDQLAEIRRLRLAQINTPHGPEQLAIIQQLAETIAALNDRLNQPFAGHFTDLERTHPFHWGLEFPEVFYDQDGQPLENPGFTVIFGNPPWEIVKPDLREFYAQFDERIEGRMTRKQAEHRIEELNIEDPRREAQWEEQRSHIEETRAYFRAATDYAWQGSGDVGTHKLFIERKYTMLSDGGRLGYIVPSGIYTDLGTKELRQMLLEEGRIESLVSLTNGVAGGEVYFPDIHRSFKITLLSARKGIVAESFSAVFAINPRIVPKPDVLLDFLADPENFIEVRRDSIARFSPGSLSLMEFQTRRDYEIADKIYDDWPLLGEKVAGNWDVEFSREFHVTDDRQLFNSRGHGLPLYEGKMIWHYDSAFADPQFWIQEGLGASALGNRQDYKQERLALRAIASSTNERTLVTAILPPYSFSVNSLFNEVGHSLDRATRFYLMSVLNSYISDYLLRQKMAANVNLFYVYQLPMPRLTAGDPYFDAVVPRAARLTCTRAEFADLWREVMGSDWDESKAAIDPAERQTLRDEIDALVAHLYGLTRDEFAHILGTFPLVFPDTDAGRARMEALLHMYDTIGMDSAAI